MYRSRCRWDPIYILDLREVFETISFWAFFFGFELTGYCFLDLIYLICDLVQLKCMDLAVIYIFESMSLF